MKKNIIVFGSNGNIGKYLVKDINIIGNILSPTSSECNLMKLKNINKFFKSIPKQKYIILYFATKVSKDKNDLRNYKSNLIMMKKIF